MLVTRDSISIVGRVAKWMSTCYKKIYTLNFQIFSELYSDYKRYNDSSPIYDD